MSNSQDVLGNVRARSTENIPARARRDYFRQAICRPYPGLTQDWLDDRPIEAWYKSRPFAAAQVTEIGNSPVRATNRPARHAPGRLQLVQHIANDGWYSQAGRELVQCPGDVILLDADQRFDSTFPFGLHVVVWDLPRDMLAPLLAAPERALAVRISGSDGAGSVLDGFARSLAREAGRLNPALQTNLLTHLCNLAARALGAAAPAREARHLSYRAARRQQVLGYIEAHLGDSQLTAERAARDLKMSRRWLHALFEEAEMGFADCVTQRRIEACRKLLNDPAHDHLSIAQIAFQSGFNDLSTFNRQFRARCAMPPREARRIRVDRGKQSR